MAVTIDGVRLLDPTLTTTRATPEPAPRLDKLDGVQLGLLANGKTNGKGLMDLVVKELSSKYQLGKVLALTKEHPSQPPTDSQIDTLAEHSMAILSAIGD